MTKRLLRGVIDFDDNKLTLDQITSNYKSLIRSGFEWPNPDEGRIFDFIRSFANENLEPPTAATIRDYFERSEELGALEKLKDIQAAIAYKRRDYYALLKDLQEQQSQNKVRSLLKETEEIVVKGRIVDKKSIKGVKAGVNYFNEKIYEIIPPETNAVTEGDVTQDAPLEWEAYASAKRNKSKVYGVLTGIDDIDRICHGIKRGELWVHAAEPGGLKTTFALNWAYNAITRYRTNVCYVSLEMKYEHLRKILCAIHTSNGIFRRQGYKSLDYRKIRDGELTPDEEAFYELALKDLETNPEYCRLKVFAPDKDVNVQDIRVHCEHLHKNLDLGLLIVDQDELVQSMRTTRDYLVDRNSVMIDLKKLAMHFNGGEGVPVLDLHQINREGMTNAEKGRGKPEEEGRYRMNHLAYSNQVERSSDYITTTYSTKEMKESGYGIVGNLKNRDNMLFNLGRIGVDMSCHRLRNWDPEQSSDISVDLGQDDVGDFAGI
jgi:replicative DNA helicase